MNEREHAMNNNEPTQEFSTFPGAPDFRAYTNQPHSGGYGDAARPANGGQAGVPGPAVAVKRKESKRWSTPSVAALLLAGAVLASGTTYVAMDTFGGSNSAVTSSFNSSGSTSSGAKTENTSNPVEPGSATDIANKVLPSVVSISVTTASGGDEGSGSIISSDGMILTNNHVVSAAANGGARIEVVLYDGRTLPAKIVATDPQTDIAVIKAEGVGDLPPISFGDSQAVNVGDAVMAIGSPLGLSSTVTTGIVSAKNRPVQATGERGGEASLIDAIQTDASINPGNSGGALVNMNGELIGIPTVIATTGGSSQTAGSIGLGFAIPIDQAERTARQLIDEGKAQHPIIGATINTRSTVIGAEIAEVNPGSPAEEAGLKSGDVVTHVDDRRVDSGVGLIAAIRSHAVGDKIALRVREGEDGPERTVEVTLTASE